MKIYVGNLAYNTTEADLRQAFEAHGHVESSTIITDRETGRSKGFGFVEMGEGAEATAAIAALNGQDFQGRALRVNEARPKTEFRGGEGGGRGQGGGFRDRSRSRPY